MLSFPNCKINLGLRILNKREDGYHNLETVFYPVPLKDALEIITASDGDTTHFTSSGLNIDGNAEDNLCLKAYHLIKKDFTDLPAVKIHLHKAIPMGAGLGGGSADAAFMLQLLNDHFKLNLSFDQLKNYALQLGSDCPFFIVNKPCIGTGRGEILEEIFVDLSGYDILLVNPLIHVNTGEAFGALKLQAPASSQPNLKQILQKPVTAWKQLLHNDFETPVFEKYPAIKQIKQTLYENGAIYAAMSGSGSTVFGLFNKNSAPAINLPPNYFVRIISLQ